MARKKKEGRRAKGIYSRSGKLYIVLSQNSIKNGKKEYENKWFFTGLEDTPANIKTASEMRKDLLLNGSNILSVDREISMSEYVDLFLAKKKRVVTDTTFSGYFYRGKHIKEFFGSIKVKGISLSDIEQFLDYLTTDSKVQFRTIKDTKSLLSSMMDQAVVDGLLPVNPVKSAKINKVLLLSNADVKEDGDDFFSYQEAQIFLSAAESHPLYELFFVTLFFGLRREEVLGLRWSCINFQKSEFTVNHTVTKGMAINRLNATKSDMSLRKYPLNDEQIEMFKQMLAKEENHRRRYGKKYKDNDYIFKHPDGSLYYPDYPTKAFGKVIKAHPELPQNITFHGLRASCVSILVHEGFDIKRIQKWVGHADINTTLKIYAKVKDKEAKQEILNGMKNYFQPKGHIKKQQNSDKINSISNAKNENS